MEIYVVKAHELSSEDPEFHIVGAFYKKDDAENIVKQIEKLYDLINDESDPIV